MGDAFVLVELCLFGVRLCSRGHGWVMVAGEAGS